MHNEFSQTQMDILRGLPCIHNEFADKIKILDDRLKKNGMSYREWDLLNDRQRDIFSHNLFLDAECASSVDSYVDGAVQSCGCGDSEEDLHHHSPVLMAAIETQRNHLPSIKISVNTNEALDHQIDKMLGDLLESEDS